MIPVAYSPTLNACIAAGQGIAGDETEQYRSQGILQYISGFLPEYRQPSNNQFNANVPAIMLCERNRQEYGNNHHGTHELECSWNRPASQPDYIEIGAEDVGGACKHHHKDGNAG